MINIITKTITIAGSIIAGVFTFFPESFFCQCKWVTQELLDQNKATSSLSAQDINIVISRLACCALIWMVALLVYVMFLTLRKAITLKGENYTICVAYGDIFKVKKCKRIIPFDECFTTKVGDATADINPTSICGQYLLAHPELNMQQLIDSAQISPEQNRSKYQEKIRYRSGTIVPNGDDLLMAFAKLDVRGKGRFFSRDEYVECLDYLWKEIENYYGEKDVCIPILGAGTTVIDGGSGASISQQDLLNMIIWSYKLSSHKIKAPHKLRIICKKNDDFSINKIKL